MSADGDFMRSTRWISEKLIERLESGEVELSEMPDLFRKAARWLEIQDECRIEWLYASHSESEEFYANRRAEESALMADLNMSWTGNGIDDEWDGTLLIDPANEEN